MCFKALIVVVIIMNAATSTEALLPYKIHGKGPSANTFMNTETYRQCPGLYERVFTDSVPRANLSAGVYTVYGSNSRPVSLRECVLACCFVEKSSEVQEECNVALLTKAGGCYHVACASNEFCLPQPQSFADDSVRTSMVLVRPVDRNGPSWTDMLFKSKQGSEQQRFHDAFDSLWRISDSVESHEEIDRSGPEMEMPNRLLYSNDVPPVDLNTKPSLSLPETVTDDMSVPQIQLRVIVDSKQVQLPENNATLEAHVISNAAAEELGQSPPPLPYHYEWITLQQPDPELKGSSGAIRNQQDNRLILSHLAQGLYMFNLTVTNGNSAVGWTLANVTVLSAVRVNSPPAIIITPTNQTVRLPNTAAILDASATTDDADVGDKVRYHWELQQGPLGYQPSLPNAPTLQLTDLTRAGQYTFQVSAVDGDGAQSKALAYVTVLPPIDYPPTADAGPDQVLYLPLNDGELVLSGNGSTDDHEIVSWEWTRVNSVDSTANNSGGGNADTNMQAVDMRDTRTAMLRLGRIIEPGVYTFQLRVEDASNQTSTAQVRLFVKEKEDQRDVQMVRPLAVVAGNGNIAISAGQTWVLLDGSNSTTTDNIVDDSSSGVVDHVLYYRWDLVQNSTSHNQTVLISNPHAAITNATGLTEAGLYQFRLQVTLSPDTNASSSTVLVNVTVAQTTTTAATAARQNTPPRAVATIADSNVQLPRNVVYLNASQSTDDDAIVSYVWRPCSAENTTATLGVGSVAEGTDKHPVLVLVMAGVRYVPQTVRACWNVTVCDSDGLCDWQAVRFNVSPDAMMEYMVEVIVGGGSTSVTVAQYDALLRSIESSVDESSQSQPIQIHVRPTVGSTTTPGYSIIALYATTTSVNSNDTSTTATTTIFLTAARLANLLQRTLVTPLMQQQLQLTAVRPASCLSVTCSGHGQCNPETRTCHCHSFWMPNVLSHTSDEWGGWDRDCSWSVLYVTLVSVAIVSVVLCLVYAVWNVLCRMTGGGGVVLMQTQQKQRYQHHRRKVRNSHSYTLIDNALVDGRVGRGGGGGAKRHPRNLHLDSDSEGQVDSGDSDRDDNVVFSSLNDKLQYT